MKRLHHRRSQAGVSGSRRAADGGAQQALGARRATRLLSPGTPARSARRACACELWAQIRTKTGRWSEPRRLSASGRSGCGISTSITSTSAAAGGYGIGYNAPAATGAALANRKYGRLTVNIQSDGDLMYAPGILWTAAHHKIPAAAHHAQQPRVSSGSDAGADHGRPAQPRHHRTAASARPSPARISLTQSLRRAWACTAKGRSPIRKILGPAITRAIDVVKRGEPALVDVAHAAAVMKGNPSKGRARDEQNRVER